MWEKGATTRNNVAAVSWRWRKRLGGGVHALVGESELGGAPAGLRLGRVGEARRGLCTEEWRCEDIRLALGHVAGLRRREKRKSILI